MKADTELYAYRRHLRRCRFFGRGGRDARADKCNCPFHIDGRYNGRRIRDSLETRSRQIAERRLAERIRALDQERAHHAQADAGETGTATAASVQRTVSEAVERFLNCYGRVDDNGRYSGDSPYSTFRKYRNSLRVLVAFCNGQGIFVLSDVSVEALEDFRPTRRISQLVWKVERQLLITFFNYCVRRKWIATNPAKELKAPHNVKPNEVRPYSLREESLILAACEQIGGGKYHRSGATYERLRAKAMVLLLRHTALRISDVATFRKDSISWDEEKATWRTFLLTQKTGESVYLPVPDVLKLALDALPLPRNAAQDCPYYFWNGHTSKRAVIGIAERTLRAVFRNSGVKDAHAHRYRHTLATRLLEQGATFVQVADILGNTAAVVEKHYGKWAKGRQDNIDRLMLAHFKTAAATFPVTLESHEKTEAVN